MKDTLQLPDPLSFQEIPLKNTSDWPRRQSEIVATFAGEIYGKTPTSPFEISFSTVKRSQTEVRNASMEEVELTITTPLGQHKATLLLTVPLHVSGPCPVFIGLNFHGNHTTHPSDFISLTENWVPTNELTGATENRASEKGRGSLKRRWPFERIIERGYAVATIYSGDFDPDFDDGFQNGIHPLFYKPGQSRPAANEWGTIGAWAWGLSRIVDYVHQDSRLDPQRIIALGHSRLGKTALWASAQDPRIGMAVSNNSGCLGASLSRRPYGESIQAINKSFPHWFCAECKKYEGAEDSLPVDQHMLLAAIAPRPLYVASASKDAWADPRGEWLSCVEAVKVYAFLGYSDSGSGFTTMPDLGGRSLGRLSYHIREGEHDVLKWDWENFMDAADLNLG